MSKKKYDEVDFKKPSLQRKILAWVLIFALIGTTVISAISLLFN